MGYYSKYNLRLRFSSPEAFKAAKKILERWVFLEELHVDKDKVTLHHVERCKGYDLQWILTKLKGITEGRIEVQGEAPNDYSVLDFRDGKWIKEIYGRALIREIPMQPDIDPIASLKRHLTEYERILEGISDTTAHAKYKADVKGVIEDLKQQIKELENL